MNFFKSIFYITVACIALQNPTTTNTFSLPRSIQKGLGYALITTGAASVLHSCVHYQTLSYKPLRFLACYALLACGHTLLDSLSKNR